MVPREILVNGSINNLEASDEDTLPNHRPDGPWSSINRSSTGERGLFGPSETRARAEAP
jgi:hypothetical protein